MTQSSTQAATSRAARPFDLPAMPVLNGEELDLRPTLREVHDRVKSRVDERYPQESEEQRAERLRTIMQRIWNMIMNFLQRYVRTMGGILRVAPSRGQGGSDRTAPGETDEPAGKEVAAPQSVSRGVAPVVPPAVQEAALQQEAHAFARHILDAGPRVELLSEPASAEEYLLTSLQQLRAVGEGQEAQAHHLKEQQQQLVARIAIAEAASPALVERELKSGAFTVLDREGKYDSLSKEILRARVQQERIRNAMAATIAAAYQHAEESGLPKERLDAVAQLFEPYWEEIVAEAQDRAKAPAAALGARDDDGMDAVLEEIGAQKTIAAHDSGANVTEVASASMSSAQASALAANASPYAKSTLQSPFAAFVVQENPEEVAARRQHYAEEHP